MTHSEAKERDVLLRSADVGSRRAPPLDGSVSGSVLDAGPPDGSRASESSSAPDSGVRLAELKEAVLDDLELRRLFTDIATYGELEEVTMKASPRARPEFVRRLPELYLKLVERRVYGAQIRYEFESASWLDTLITTPTGWRLVRVRLPD